MNSKNDDTANIGQNSTQPGGIIDNTVMIDVPRQLGSYQLRRLLGRGGMGEVWLAFDTNLEREVAIKLMRKELLQNQDATRRFAREARAVARLNHPNIVHVYAFGDDHGLLYFVMELVDGETVAQRMKREQVIKLEDAISIIMQAIEGLGYACERGIIHRDIKPSNIMLTSDGRVKIADFGLAKMVLHDTQMTAVGTAMGSPNYMSPEQARGEEADHRSDIYALGVSLYQMLCGALPFTADSPVSVLLKQIQEPLPEPDCLRSMKDGAILSVIKKMTAKASEDRYQTYAELAAALIAIEPIPGYRGAHTATASMPAAHSAIKTETSDTQGGSGVPPLSVPPNTNKVIPPPPPPPPPAASPLTEPPETTAAPKQEHRKKRSGLLIAAILTAIVLVAAALAAVAWYFGKPSDQIISETNTASSQSPAPGASDPAPTPSAQAQLTPAGPAATNTTAAPPSPSPTTAPRPGAAPATPALPAPSPTMQPVDVNAELPISPTPYPGQSIDPTPRPSLRNLLPAGIPTVASRSSNNAAPTYVLGTPGAPAGEMISAYRDGDARMLQKQYPAGTEVTVIGQTATMLRIMTPDSGALYIYKGMARPKQ